MAWDVTADKGVYLPQIGWHLDGSRPSPRSFVSHAHADHIARHQEILCTPATARLMQTRLPSSRRTEHRLPFGQREQLAPGTVVTLHPAGHILGSAQCHLEHEAHGTLLYTGDFKLRTGLAAESCTTPPADVLIMETTFGRPRYTMPPADEVFVAIIDFCRQALADAATPILFAYSLGKTQELIAGLGAAGMSMMLHPQGLKMTRIYEDLGMRLPPCREFDPDALAGQVVICPPHAPRTGLLAQIPSSRTAMISGWALDPGALYRYRCDAAFPLSDHADFPELLAFVERVQPRLVYTVHGFAGDFARTLRERGIEAWALGEDNQLDLGLAPTAS